jgi:hypothetical protein
MVALVTHGWLFGVESIGGEKLATGETWSSRMVFFHSPRGGSLLMALVACLSCVDSRDRYTFNSQTLLREYCAEIELEDKPHNPSIIPLQPDQTPFRPDETQ